MATLKHPTTSPPGGFKYRQSGTGLTITSDSLQSLIDKVVAHRRYKKLTPDDPATVSLEVQRQICTRLGRNECNAEEKDNWVPLPDQPRFTLMDILAFSKTVFEFIKKGAELVPIEEAKRRRDICLACPLNQRAQGCKCAVFYKMVNSIIPKDRLWDELHVCQVCHCSNAAKVNVPLSVIEADKRKLTFPVHCWQYRDLPPPQ